MASVTSKALLCAISGTLALVACGKSKNSDSNTPPPPVSLYSGQMPPSYYGGRQAPPPPVLPVANQTAGLPLDTLSTLDQQGSWTTLGGVRYFVPRTQLIEGETEWAPVRHGHWRTDARGQQVWDSTDAFGGVTDHRGLWRHHRTLGWIWRCFPDNHYEPNVVSFLETKNQYGWLPYRREYRDLYRGTAQYGFDDGYGEETVEEIEHRSRIYGNTIGLSTLPRRSFRTPDVIGDMVARRAVTPHAHTIERVHSNFAPAPAVKPATRAGRARRAAPERAAGERAAAEHAVPDHVVPDHVTKSPAAAAPAPKVTVKEHHSEVHITTIGSANARRTKPAKTAAAPAATPTIGFSPDGFIPNAAAPAAEPAAKPWVDPQATRAPESTPATEPAAPVTNEPSLHDHAIQGLN